MRACARACAAFVRVLGAAVGVVGCVRGWLLHACTALEDGNGDGVAGSGWLFSV